MKDKNFPSYFSQVRIIEHMLKKRRSKKDVVEDNIDDIVRDLGISKESVEYFFSDKFSGSRPLPGVNPSIRTVKCELLDKAKKDLNEVRNRCVLTIVPVLVLIATIVKLFAG